MCPGGASEGSALNCSPVRGQGVLGEDPKMRRRLWFEWLRQGLPVAISGVVQWSIQGQRVRVGCSACPSSVKLARLVQSCLGDLAALLMVTRICALKMWVQPGFFLKQSSRVTGWVSGQLPMKVVLVMTMWVSRNDKLCAGGHLCPPTSTPSAILTAARTLGQQPLCSPTALPGALPGLPTAKERGEQLLLCLAGAEPRDRELPGPFSELQVSGRLAPGGITAPSICQVHLSVSQVCNYGRVVIAVVRTTQNAIL